MIDLRSIRRDEAGQGMVEYGLIIGLIAIIVIAVFVALGGPLDYVAIETSKTRQ